MPDVPDVYSDSLSLSTNVWGVTLAFGTRPLRRPEEAEAPPEIKAIVRMSHLHAKVVAMVMRRVLKGVESEVGEIEIPDAVREALDLTGDEW